MLAHLIRRIAAACLAFSAALPTASAQPRGAALDVNGSVPLFCRDSSNTFQPFVGTNYGRLQEAFIRQFGWRHELRSISPSVGVLTFSADHRNPNAERIYYDVQVYNGGIALLHMHVRLRGTREDLTASRMCFQTFGIVNVQ